MSTPTLDYTCASCGEPATLRCVRCLGAFYCGKECQKKMWREHKVLCKEAAKTRDGMSIDEFDKHFEEFKRLAEMGDADAQFNLGLSYQYGTGVAIDLPKAIKWYTLAAEAGFAAAQCNLGTCFSNGDGVAVDKREAVKWYTRAAEAGNAEAQCNLGHFYFTGDGEFNYLESFKWCTLAANAGAANAQFMLGMLHATGRGVAVDKREAVKWLTLAAAGGIAQAVSALLALSHQK